MAVNVVDCTRCKKPIRSYRDYYYNGGKPMHIKCASKKKV